MHMGGKKRVGGLATTPNQGLPTAILPSLPQSPQWWGHRVPATQSRGLSHPGPLEPSGLFLSWGLGPFNSSLPTWLELPHTASSGSRAFFLLSMCIQRGRGSPGVILSCTLPRGRATQDPGLVNPERLWDKFLPRRAPRAQRRVHVDTTCTGVHSSLSWCPSFLSQLALEFWKLNFVIIYYLSWGWPREKARNSFATRTSVLLDSKT